MLVDNCPCSSFEIQPRFVVVVTSNMFGDILSDEASMITRFHRHAALASLGKGTLGFFEPIHGSAPDIAGTGAANPLATILSAAMLLRYSLNQPEAAGAIERAVQRALEEAGARRISRRANPPSVRVKWAILFAV